MKAVILAGGQGARLEPYTTNFPKPLMPVGDRPILETVIKQLERNGIKDIIIATGHLEELIRVFFQNGEKFGVDITYSKEKKPLGTAGPLNLMRHQLRDTFLLMNGDILCDIDFRKFMNFHKKNGHTATIALSQRKVGIDFGVVEIDSENRFSQWNEKPEIGYLVSMGIYLFEPEALENLPKDVYITLPDFIVELHQKGKKVAGYVHDGYWLDIGRPEDYKKACEDFGRVVDD